MLKRGRWTDDSCAIDGAIRLEQAIRLTIRGRVELSERGRVLVERNGDGYRGRSVVRVDDYRAV